MLRVIWNGGWARTTEGKVAAQALMGMTLEDQACKVISMLYGTKYPNPDRVRNAVAHNPDLIEAEWNEMNSTSWRKFTIMNITEDQQ